MGKLWIRRDVASIRRLVLGAGVVAFLGAATPAASLADSCEDMKAEASKPTPDRALATSALKGCAGPSGTWPREADAAELTTLTDAAAKLEGVVCEPFPHPARGTEAHRTAEQTTDVFEACAYAFSARVQGGMAHVKSRDEIYDVEARYLYRRYKDLRSWSRANGDRERTAVAVDVLANGNSGRHGPAPRRGVRDLMADRGLRNGISALFVAGYLRPSLSNSEPQDGQSEGQAESSDPLQGSDNVSTPVTGHLIWSSRHWTITDASDIVARNRLVVDGSLTGRVGLQPAVSLVKPESGVLPAPAPAAGAATEETSPQERAVIQDAFIWDLGPRLHFHIGDNWEVEGMGRAGQTHLTSDIVTLTSGNLAQVFVPLGGPGSSGFRWFYEAGGTLRYTLQSLELLHEQNGLVEPAFEISFWKRKDDRLEATEKGQVVFVDGLSRNVLRFAINGVPVKNAPGQKDNAKLFTISFAVEHQWGGSVPSTTAFSIRGNVDLIKALRGSGS